MSKAYCEWNWIETNNDWRNFIAKIPKGLKELPHTEIKAINDYPFGIICEATKGVLTYVLPEDIQQFSTCLKLYNNSLKDVKGNKIEKKDYICLKWGTLKGWSIESKKALELLKEYGDLGVSMGAAQQQDTPRQKEILCEMIDASTADEILLDWDGISVSKEEAKKYIMEYGKGA